MTPWPSSRSDARPRRPVRFLPLLRALFVSVLLTVVVSAAILIPRILDRFQRDLAEQHYQAVAAAALEQAVLATQVRLAGLRTLGHMMGRLVPESDEYPFVTVEGFEELGALTLETIRATRMAFCPLVEVSQQAKWEEFAHAYFVQRNESVTSSFGPGIWGVDPSLNTSDNRYHHTDGSHAASWQDESEPHYQSNRTVLSPVLQFVGPPSLTPPYMLNIRSTEERIRVVDDMMTCVEQQIPKKDCSVITDFIILLNDPDKGPSASMFVPVCPFNDPNELTAFLAVPVIWADILKDAFADSVSGIDCVLKTARTAYTYKVSHGVARPSVSGDFHDPKYNHWERSIVLNENSNGSPKYELFLYPTDELYSVYQAVKPSEYAFGAVAIIVFTSLLFVLYDFCVCRESTAKRHLMESKRQFVRYISHEVRTPLNCVCVGLSLMQEKIATEAGFSDASSLEAAMKAREGRLYQNSGNTSNENSCQRVDEDTAERFSFTQELLKNSHCSVEVLNGFLQYDKIEAGTLNMTIKEVDMLTVLRQITSEFRLQASTKSLQFRVVFSDETGEFDYGSEYIYESGHMSSSCSEMKVVLGDDIQLRQVLRNLISNAIKFTPEGGKIEIVSRLHCSSSKPFARGLRTAPPLHKILDTSGCRYLGYMSVEISDTGAGMTQNQLSRLFHDGTQFNVNELQQGQGTGLGLFITKGILEQHSGTIVVSSPGLEKGSKFTMTLPLFSSPDITQLPSEMNDDTLRSQQFSPSKTHVTECRKVLVVDDSRCNRKMMSHLLEHRGHTCETCESAEDCIRLAVKASEQGEPFDTILMDFALPVMKGPEASRILMCDKGIDPYIVGVTGSIFPEDVELFRANGAQAVLAKPFRMCELEELWEKRRKNAVSQE